MGSGDENKSVLKFLIGAVEFFKAFGGMFLGVDSIIDNFSDSGPLDFFFIMFMGDGFINMRKREVIKVGVIFFELFKNLSVVYGLNFDSLPIFVLFVGSALLERNDFLEDLFGDRIPVNELIVNDRVVVPPVYGGVLATEHIHLGVFFLFLKVNFTILKFSLFLSMQYACFRLVS